MSSRKSKAAAAGPQVSPLAQALKDAEFEYFLGYHAAMKHTSNRRLAMQQWRKKHNEHIKYNVLSHSVRHELNKYFFDVSRDPSRTQREQLWHDLQQIDSTVQMTKMVRWFQNKRAYMKNKYGDGDAIPESLRLSLASLTMDRDAASHSSSDSESATEESDSSDDE